MYLMNVPPVAATHTEWRTCGPSRGYSLPLCFNDSDTELSTRGTPIPEKVQMIIESLRSTQSSLNMGDEIEGNVPSGQEVHPQVCKVAMSPFVGPKTKGSTENRQADDSSPVNYESHDSDSDDSVDRGIEEAILEYLKEKDDHKRKAEPSNNFLPSSKIPRKNPPIPEISKQHSDSNKVLIASNQFPKCVKIETPTAPATIPMKKLIKNKAPFKENPVKRMDTNETTAKSLTLSKEQTKNPSKTNSLFHKLKCPVTVKVEEDSPDSSSDDGIEEAIQRYQLEKKEKQNRRDVCQPHIFKEESDSTSDDGIEEAIRCYQLEQLKEKSVLKPFLHKQQPISKSSIHPIESTSTENLKRHKSRKKKNRTGNEVKSVLPPPSSICIPKNTLTGSPKGKGNGLLSCKVETFREQHTLATPKANTTAELMCAEAILDISKAVMPGAFNPNVGLSSCTPSQSVSLLSNCPDDGSDDSSIDSEDGIEQEIRKFLEQKAQMHKQPPSSATITTEPIGMNELDKVKTKQVATQKKAIRLSLTQKRKHKEEACNVSKESVVDDRKDIALKSLPLHGRESSPLVFCQRSQTQPLTGLQKTEQSGDKSSSLDSDEDLDTAIKDLLKTKKKLKKKTRDLKLKSRKCLKDAGPLLGNALQIKKLKPDPISKRGGLKKVHKTSDDMREKSKLSKKNILQNKQTKRKEHIMHASDTDKLKGTGGRDTPLLHNTQAVQIKEDSSSVDSDDSIEQEIRKFLAEKAKVSTAEKSKDGDVSRNGNAEACTPQVKDIKLENQLAEIPTKCITLLPGQSLISSPESKPSQDREPFPAPQISLADNSSSAATVGAQSCLSSALSNSPSLLEPADGAGAARTEKRRPSTGSGDVQDVTSEMVRARPFTSPSIAQSRSDSIKWRQSLGLPTTETRSVPLSRTPFHVTSSKISETASTTSPYQMGGINPKPQTPVTVWSSARSSRSVAPFPSAAETTVNTMSHSPFSNLLSAVRQHPGMSFTQRLAPGGHRAHYPIAGQAESMVHMSKDQSVFVELESHRTNHVQVRSREMSEGKERRDLPSEKKREGESMKTDDKEVQLGRAEEDFVDETDCESDRRRNPEKKQGFSTLSLSSAIDPGITLRPCIALTTEERSRRFSRRYMAVNCKKGMASLSGAPVQKKTKQQVKRKLQFVPVSRRNEAASQHSMAE
ncbi:protein phosphatase 1 regulatory subunit 26 [Centroberyx affinis]|uniref:protein phosphatase 1 regulatory subunit 26 n=1 Tax=Centroberyx affinis TaxID=166261 RepID=UPI003A5C51DC